jgi:hypothetical protein
MAKARKYFTLLVNDNGLWAPQFGDYDRQVVEDEMRDEYLDKGYRAKRLKIIATADDQASIDARVKEINAKLAEPKAPKVDYAAILKAAHEAADAAQEGMVEDLNAFDCGFAWVTIDGRHGLAKWARKELARLRAEGEHNEAARPVLRMHMRKLGDKAWPGGWQWWCPGAFNGQAIGIHLAGAQAFQAVLLHHGIDALVDSRLD